MEELCLGMNVHLSSTHVETVFKEAGSNLMREVGCLASGVLVKMESESGDRGPYCWVCLAFY